VGKHSKLIKDVDSMEYRTRDMENTLGQTLVKLDIVIANQDKSNSTFENQGGYIVEVNSILKDVINKIDGVASSQNSMNQTINETSNRLDIVEKKQTKFIHYGTAAVTLIGIIWIVATWAISYVDTQKAKVTKLEYYEAKRYAELESLRLLIDNQSKAIKE
jgi:hypothetical protein